MYSRYVQEVCTGGRYDTYTYVRTYMYMYVHVYAHVLYLMLALTDVRVRYPTQHYSNGVSFREAGRTVQKSIGRRLPLSGGEASRKIQNI